MTKQISNLPKLNELHWDVAEAFKNDQFLLLVNQPPHEAFLKKHPLVKTKNKEGKSVASTYMPIDKVEFLLQRIFQTYKIEVLSVQQLFQSIQVTIRLHYRHPTNGEWYFHDGVGAVGVQTDAGMSASDLGAIKFDAVQKATPAAKSYAIKDAAEHIGKLFGRDLNKWDTVMFTGSGYEQHEPEPEQTSKTNNEDENLEL